MSARKPLPINPAQNVLDVLTRLDERGVWSGSQSVLAVECGISVRTLARRLESLKSDGSVQIERVAGKPCVYRVGAAIEASAVVPSCGAVEEISNADQLAVGLVGSTASANAEKVDCSSRRPSEDRKPAARTRSRITTRIVAVVGSLIAAVFGARTVKPKRGRGPDPRQMTFDFEGDYHPQVPSDDQKQTVADTRCDGGNPSPARDNKLVSSCCVGVEASPTGRDVRSDGGLGRSSPYRDDQPAVNQSSRADAVPSTTVKAAAKPLVSIASDAQTAGARRADQLRASSSRPLSPPDSIDLPWKSFKLPFGTDRDKLRDTAFIEDKIYAPAVKLGIVTIEEASTVFSLVAYVLRVEPKTPAKLLTYILRGGKRLKPWRADLTQQDYENANQLVRRSAPKKIKSVTSELVDDLSIGHVPQRLSRDQFERKRESEMARLLAKYEVSAK